MSPGGLAELRGRGMGAAQTESGEDLISGLRERFVEGCGWREGWVRCFWRGDDGGGDLLFVMKVMVMVIVHEMHHVIEYSPGLQRDKGSPRAAGAAGAP